MARADGVGLQDLVMGLMIAMTPCGSILKGLLRAEPLGAMILDRLVGGSMLAMMLWEGVLETECLRRLWVGDHRVLIYLGKYFRSLDPGIPRMRLQRL